MSKIDLLSALKVTRINAPGMYLDGKGLYLQCLAPKNGNEQRITKSWLFRFTLNGKTREMGLGPFPAVSLAKAREKAAKAREQVADRIDPIDDRRAVRTAAIVEKAKAVAQSVTFDQCADAYITANEDRWRSAKYRQTWRNSIAQYVSPVIGKLPVGAVDTALVLQSLDPIWKRKPVMASYLRGRIEAILDWATVRGYRKGDNPARWKGHLKQALPDQAHAARHHAALPHQEIAGFMEELRKREAISARALEFTILTATRTGETTGARWSEISMDTKTWIIPGHRMKAGREHRVPLSDAALKVLKQMAKQRRNDFVFPGDHGGLSKMAFPMLLERMKRGDLTVHGFRSTFRDWASDCADQPREVAEAALAHILGNKTEQAYARSDLFEKRRKLMSDWAEFCARPPANVLQFPGDEKKRRGRASGN